jgi:DNA-binding GntR family transcriptional regulator
MSARESSLGNDVYNRIKQDIVSSRLKPGEPLLEEKLSKDFKVSRTPIREALKKLNHDGLVRIVPHKGAFVRVMSSKDIREIFEVREAIEGYVAGQATTQLSELDLEMLARLAKDLRRRNKGLGHTDLRNAWETLRQTLIRVTHNDRIRSILDTMKDQIEVSRYYASFPPGRIEELLSDFLAVVRALQNRDSTRTVEAFQSHLRKSKAVLLTLFCRDREN